MWDDGNWVNDAHPTGDSVVPASLLSRRCALLGGLADILAQVPSNERLPVLVLLTPGSRAGLEQKLHRLGVICLLSDHQAVGCLYATPGQVLRLREFEEVRSAWLAEEIEG
jgi:hypothetical protein